MPYFILMVFAALNYFIGKIQFHKQAFYYNFKKLKFANCPALETYMY